MEEKSAKEVAAAEEVGGIGAWVFLRELSDLTDDQGLPIIKELDPDRPVVCIQAPRNTIEELRRYNATCDVSGADIYPVSVPMGIHSHLPNKQCSVVGDYTKRMIEVVNGQKPIFMVLQVTWSGVLPERGKTLVFLSRREGTNYHNTSSRSKQRWRTSEARRRSPSRTRARRAGRRAPNRWAPQSRSRTRKASRRLLR